MPVYIDEEVCKGCGLCVHYCPQGVFRMSDRRNKKGYDVAEPAAQEKCKVCHTCEISCPDLALCVVDEAASDA